MKFKFRLRLQKMPQVFVPLLGISLYICRNKSENETYSNWVFVPLRGISLYIRTFPKGVSFLCFDEFSSPYEELVYIWAKDMTWVVFLSIEGFRPLTRN